MNSSTTDRDRPEILVRAGASAEDDIFIEVHVFGDMVAATFQSVRFVGSSSSPRDTVLRDAIIEKLRAAGVATTAGLRNATTAGSGTTSVAGPGIAATAG